MSTPSPKSLRPTNDTPTRLDLAITPLLSLSRSKLQKAIKDGRILVDGVQATSNTMVTSKNEVTYDSELLDAPKGIMPTLEIVYEDADVLIVNKPAGLLAHPAPGSNEFTLADALKAYFPAMEHVGDDPIRAGLVHRLDRDASGLVAAAKTREAFVFLKQQFSARKTIKRYTVLVLGDVLDEFGTITFPIARSATKGRMAARPTSQEGREAITHYEVVERFGGHATLLNVTIETGRTHQIRAHFFALQHPVIGDTLYTQKGLKQIDIGRLFLHARELTLPLPSGETPTFIAPVPEVLLDILEKMRTTKRKR